MPDMRPDQALRRVRMGDFPPDTGARTDSQADAMIAAAGRRAYMAQSPAAQVAQGQAARARSQEPELLRLRQLIEATNVVAQDHPVQDIPYGGKNSYFVQTQANGPGLDNVYTVGVTPMQHIMFVRTVHVDLFDATAQNDLFLTFRINGEPVENLALVPVMAFLAYRRNTYIYSMPNNTFEIVVRNTSLFVPHDARIKVHGWVYTLPDVRENARGVMQQHST